MAARREAPGDLPPGQLGRRERRRRRRPDLAGDADGRATLEVVGLFQFSSGFQFGGEGFAAMALDPAREGDGQAAGDRRDRA